MKANYIYATYSEIGEITFYGPYEADVADARNFFKYRPNDCGLIRVHIENDPNDPTDTERKIYVWRKGRGWEREKELLAGIDNAKMIHLLMDD